MFLPPEQFRTALYVHQVQPILLLETHPFLCSCLRSLWNYVLHEQITRSGSGHLWYTYTEREWQRLGLRYYPGSAEVCVCVYRDSSREPFCSSWAPTAQVENVEHGAQTQQFVQLNRTPLQRPRAESDTGLIALNDASIKTLLGLGPTVVEWSPSLMSSSVVWLTMPLFFIWKWERWHKINKKNRLLSPRLPYVCLKPLTFLWQESFRCSTTAL